MGSHKVRRRQATLLGETIVLEWILETRMETKKTAVYIGYCFTSVRTFLKSTLHHYLKRPRCQTIDLAHPLLIHFFLWSYRRTPTNNEYYIESGSNMKCSLSFFISSSWGCQNSGEIKKYSLNKILSCYRREFNCKYKQRSWPDSYFVLAAFHCN